MLLNLLSPTTATDQLFSGTYPILAFGLNISVEKSAQSLAVLRGHASLFCFHARSTEQEQFALSLFGS